MVGGVRDASRSASLDAEHEYAKIRLFRSLDDANCDKIKEDTFFLRTVFRMRV